MPDPSFDIILPEVAIVILNWNGRAYLEKFLPSVIASTYANKRVIVADNADFCPPYLERVRAANSGYLSVPFADDIELSIRLTGALS